MALVLLWLWALAACIHFVMEERTNMLNLLKGIWGLFGRNQWALIFIHATVIGASIFATWLSESATAVDWLDFIWKYGLGAAATFSVPSGGIKIAGVIKNGKKPADVGSYSIPASTDVSGR
jgi:hypothetical protein